MATRTKTNANRTTLVDGCGTILKNNRLSGGYKLVKRKRVAGASASTTASKRKAGRPAKAKMVAPVTAPKRKAGRPAKVKMVETITEKVVITAPKRKAGRPAKAKMVAPVTAPVKRRVGKTKTTKTMKSSVKPTAKRRGRRVSSKA
jgi:hypothetical protein